MFFGPHVGQTYVAEAQGTAFAAKGMEKNTYSYLVWINLLYGI